MDLSKFKNSSRIGNAKSDKHGFLSKNFNRAKYWILPPTSDRRKERLSQYKDFAMFIGAVLAIAVFEDKIKNFLEI